MPYFIIYLIINDIELLKNSCKLIIELANLENMVTKSTFNDIYISCLIGTFKK